MKAFSKWFLPLFILCSFQAPAFSQYIQQLGPNYFVAGIPTAEFEFFAAPQFLGKQRQSNWCWAACVQMVLNYHGLYVSQEQVVQRIYGTLIDRPAGPQQILNALSGWAPDVRGRYSAIHTQYGVYSASDIVSNLSFKWPIIVGLQNPTLRIGHAYVLTAIYYSVDAYNNPIVHKVALRDPWPKSPSRQELSWQQFLARQPQFFKVWVQRL
jgi:hypothetical protein